MNEESDDRIMRKDAGFDLSPSALYLMMMSLGRSSLDAAVFDPAKKRFVAFQHHTIFSNSGKQEYFEKVSEIIKSEELLRLTYKSVRMLWQSQCATLVPAPLYEAGAEKNYLQFNQNLNEGDVVLSDKMRTVDAYNIFGVPAELLSVVRSLRPLMHHHASVLVEALLVLNRNNINPQQVFVNVHAGFFDLVVIEDRKLRFCNSFAFSSAEDFIYFVLFVFEQLKIIPGQTTLTLSGDILKNSAIYDILYKYIRQIDFAQPIEQVRDSYILLDLPTYQYQNLFNTILCEL